MISLWFCVKSIAFFLFHDTSQRRCLTSLRLLLWDWHLLREWCWSYWPGYNIQCPVMCIISRYLTAVTHVQGGLKINRRALFPLSSQSSLFTEAADVTKQLNLVNICFVKHVMSVVFWLLTAEWCQRAIALWLSMAKVLDSLWVIEQTIFGHVT